MGVVGRRLALLAALAVVVAGCGTASGGNSVPDAASIVPQSALAYVTVNTDQGSDQFSSAKAVFDKFPAAPKVIADLKSMLTSNGSDPTQLAASVGPVLDVALLGDSNKPGAGEVCFAQPTDVQTFVSQLGPNTVHEQIDGWTVVAGSQQMLDLVKNSTSHLTDSADYQAAIATIPGVGDAVARGYVSPVAIAHALAPPAAKPVKGGFNVVTPSVLQLAGLTSTSWVAGALTSSDGAAKLELHAKTQATSGATSSSSLTDQIPSGSTAAVSLTGAGPVLTGGLDKELQALPKGLATALAPVLGALGGPVIAYVRPGAPVPEVTIAARPDHPAAVAAGVGALIKNLTGKDSSPAQISGATMLKVDLGFVAIYYGTTDNGEVVVTDSTNAVAELNGSAGKLTDDSGFKDAKSAAGMPDDNGGFVYVDVKDLLPTVEGLASLVNKPIPADLDANLKPLDTVLGYGSRDNGVTTIVAYAKTN
jgi:hypothetical protein